MKEESEQFTTFVSLLTGEVCFFVSLFPVVGLMLAVMANSFALPPHILYLFGWQEMVRLKIFRSKR